MMISASSRQFLKRSSRGEYLNHFSLFFAISYGALAGGFIIRRSFFLNIHFTLLD